MIETWASSAWKRPSAGVLAVGIVLAPVLAAATVEPSPERPARPVEVTDTARGRAFAAEAAERAVAAGTSIAADDFAIWEVGGRLVAGPPGAVPDIQPVRGPNGADGERVSVAEPIVDGTRPAVEQQAVAVEAAGWHLVGSSCWIEERRDGDAWIDVCYHKHRATSDGSSRYDYYALKLFATAGLDGCCWYELGDQWIEAARNGGDPQRWHDWSPRSDASVGSCTSVNLSVRVNGYGLSAPFTQCETWDITKYAAAGRFRNRWKEGFCMQVRGEREVAFNIASRVAQGSVPYWKFTWFNGRDWAGCTS